MAAAAASPATSNVAAIAGSTLRRITVALGIDLPLSDTLARSWFLCGERAILERQSIAPATTLDDIAGLGRFVERDDLIAVRTRDLVRDRRSQLVALLPQPEGEARSVRTVDHLPRSRSRRHDDVLTAIWTTN